MIHLCKFFFRGVISAVKVAFIEILKKHCIVLEHIHPSIREYKVEKQSMFWLPAFQSELQHAAWVDQHVTLSGMLDAEKGSGVG